MLKKSITYENFNGQEVTEDFYFHMSKAELIEMEFTQTGGMQKFLEKIVADDDKAAILTEFKKIILMSYGQKSVDGARFRKDESLRQDFQDSPAYDVLFMELCTNAGKASDFINGIMPKGLESDMAAVREPNRAERRHPSDPAAKMVDPPEEQGKQEGPVLLTRDQLVEMDDAELRSGLASGKYKLQ